MAKLLGEQSQQTPQGQMVSGHFVAPSWTQHAANLLRAYGARKGEDAAMADMQKLSEQRRTEGIADMQKIASMLRGTPENAPGDGVGPTMPATGPDLLGALAAAKQSRDPALQSLAPALLTSLMPKTSEGVVINGQLVDKFTGRPMGSAIPKQAEPFSLSPGSVRFDPQGNKIAEVVKPPEPFTLNPGAVRFDPQGTPIAQLANPNQPFNPDGTPNTAYQNFKIEERKAGRPSTTVNVDTASKPLLTELGKGIGENIVSDFRGAQAAAQTLQNVAQIRNGLGNIISGPTANTRVKLYQIGELMGINGADATERLKNTRAAIQGLARQELSAAGSMKGQGAITESERGILRRAEAGDIAELTVPELQTLLGALEKTARSRIAQNDLNRSRLSANPNARDVIPYMEVPVPGGSSPSAADIRSQADKVLGRK